MTASTTMMIHTILIFRLLFYEGYLPLPSVKRFYAPTLANRAEARSEDPWRRLSVLSPAGRWRSMQRAPRLPTAPHRQPRASRDVHSPIPAGYGAPSTRRNLRALLGRWAVAPRGSSDGSVRADGPSAARGNSSEPGTGRGARNDTIGDDRGHRRAADPVLAPGMLGGPNDRVAPRFRLVDRRHGLGLVRHPRQAIIELRRVRPRGGAPA